MNDLVILPIVEEGMALDHRDGRSGHDVVAALAQGHPAYLSRFYLENRMEFLEEANRAWGPRGERLRDKVMSLN